MDGTWLTVRKDPRNLARADVAGRMNLAPTEVWQRPTGANILYAREFAVDGSPALLVQAGATLQLSRWDGAVLWRNATIGAVSQSDTPVETSVVRVADFDGDGLLEVLYQPNLREWTLLDLATGKQLWSWEMPPSTFTVGYKLAQENGGIRFICFPCFSTEGWCWDFTGNRAHPRLRWHRDYAGKFLCGFGPSVILADMNGDGRSEVVIGSKAEGDIIYQGVLDAETGEVLYDGTYSAEPDSPIISGRPYGLIRAVDLDGDGQLDILTVACLVEEYYAAARNTGEGFARLWGRAVEKDFPEDHRELQPRLSSVANLRAARAPEVVLGLWEDGQWRTLVLEAATGRPRGELAGCYFWGCADLNGDGCDEIVVSREAHRRPQQPTTLLVLAGDTLQPIAELPSAGVFPSHLALRSPLPDDTAFLAMRRDPVFVTMPEGGMGMLARTFIDDEPSATVVWGGLRMQVREIAGPQMMRADVQEERILLTDAAGRIHRYNADLQPTGQSLQVCGRTPSPLVWRVSERTELVFDESGGKVTGGAIDYAGDGRLDGEWSVAGVMPALHVDRTGHGRLVTADVNEDERLTYGTSILQIAYQPAVWIYEWPVGSAAPVRIPLEHPPFVTLLPFGDEFRLLVNMQTGTHTNALACYNGEGALLWRDEASGTYPKPAGVGEINGDDQWLIIADDHGFCKIYDASGGLLAEPPGWPPAYTLPMIGPFGVFRSSGINGLKMIDGEGHSHWLAGSAGPEGNIRSSRYFNCLGSVADLTGEGSFTFGILTEDGLFECLDLVDGSLRWSVDLGYKPSNSSVVSGDVIGSGYDQFLVGLPDGKLICLGESNGQAIILWQKAFAAGIGGAIIADVDGDGLAEIVLSTADGVVRILK